MPKDGVDFIEEPQSAVEPPEKYIAPADTVEEQQFKEKSPEKDISVDGETSKSHADLMHGGKVEETKSPEVKLRDNQEIRENSPKDDMTPVNIVEEKEREANQSEKYIRVSGKIEQLKCELTPTDIVEKPVTTAQRSEEGVLLNEAIQTNNEVATVDWHKGAKSRREPESATPDGNTKDDVEIVKAKEMFEDLSQKDITTADLTAKEKVVPECQGAVDSQDKDISASEETLKDDAVDLEITPTYEEQHQKEIQKDSVVAELPPDEETENTHTYDIDLSEETKFDIEPAEKDIAAADTVERQQIAEKSPAKDISADEKTENSIAELIPLAVDKTKKTTSPKDDITPVDIAEGKQSDADQSKKYIPVSGIIEHEKAELTPKDIVEEPISTEKRSEEEIHLTGETQNIEIATVDADEEEVSRQEPLEQKRFAQDVCTKDDIDISEEKKMSEDLSQQDLLAAELTTRDEVEITPIDIAEEEQRAVDQQDTVISTSEEIFKDNIVGVIIAPMDGEIQQNIEIASVDTDNEEESRQEPREKDSSTQDVSSNVNIDVCEEKELSEDLSQHDILAAELATTEKWGIKPIDIFEEQQGSIDQQDKVISPSGETLKDDVIDVIITPIDIDQDEQDQEKIQPGNQEAEKTITYAIDFSEEKHQCVIEPSEKTFDPLDNVEEQRIFEESSKKDYSADEEILKFDGQLMPVKKIDEVKSSEGQFKEDQELDEQSLKDVKTPVDIIEETQSEVEQSVNDILVYGETEQGNEDFSPIGNVEEQISAEEWSESDILLTEETPKDIEKTTFDKYKEEESRQDPLRKESSIPKVSTRDDVDIDKEKEMSEDLSQKDLSTSELTKTEEAEITPIDNVAEHQGALYQKDKDIAASLVTWKDNVFYMGKAPTDADLKEQHQEKMLQDNVVAELPENQEAEKTHMDTIDFSEETQFAKEPSEKYITPVMNVEEQQTIETSSEKDIFVDEETVKPHVELMPSDQVDETKRPMQRLRECQESVEQSPQDDKTHVNIVEDQQNKADQSEKYVSVSDEIEQEKGKLMPIYIVEEGINKKERSETFEEIEQEKVKLQPIDIVEEPISTDERSEKDILMFEETKTYIEIATVDTDKEEGSRQDSLEKESSILQLSTKVDIDNNKEKEMLEDLSQNDLLTAEEDGEITPIDTVEEHLGAVDQQDKVISASEETLKGDAVGVVILLSDADQDEQHQEETPKDSEITELQANQETGKRFTDAIDLSEEETQCDIGPSVKDIAPADTVEEQRIVGESSEKNISADEESEKFGGQLMPVDKVDEFISPEEKFIVDQESVQDAIISIDIGEEKQSEVNQSEKGNSVTGEIKQEKGEPSLIDVLEEPIRAEYRSEKDILLTEETQKDTEITTDGKEEEKGSRQEALEMEISTAKVSANDDVDISEGKEISEDVPLKDLSTTEETEEEEVKITPINIVAEQRAVDPQDKNISASKVKLKDDVVDEAITHTDAYEDEQRQQEEMPRDIEGAELPSNLEAEKSPTITVALCEEETQSDIEPSEKDIAPVDVFKEHHIFEESSGIGNYADEKTANSDIDVTLVDKVDVCKGPEEQQIEDQKSVEQKPKDDITPLDIEKEKQIDVEQSEKDVSESGVIEKEKGVLTPIDIVEEPITAKEHQEKERSVKEILLTEETTKSIEIMPLDTEKEEVNQQEPLQKQSSTRDLTTKEDVYNGEEKGLSDDRSQKDLSITELTEKDDVEITPIHIVPEHQGAVDKQEKDISASVETLKDVDVAITATDADLDTHQRKVEIPKDSEVAELPANEEAKKTPEAATDSNEESQSAIEPSEEDIVPADTVEEQQIFEKSPEKHISVDEKTAKPCVAIMLVDKVDPIKSPEEQQIENQKTVEQSPKDDITPLDIVDEMRRDGWQSEKHVSISGESDQEKGQLTPIDIAEESRRSEEWPEKEIFFTEETPKDIVISAVDTDKKEVRQQEPLQKKSSTPVISTKDDVDIGLEKEMSGSPIQRDLSTAELTEKEEVDITPIDIVREYQGAIDQQDKDISASGVILKDDVVDVAMTPTDRDQDEQQHRIEIPNDSVVVEQPAIEEVAKTPTAAIDCHEETQSATEPSEKSIVHVENVEESAEKDIFADKELAKSDVELTPVDKVEGNESTEEQYIEDQVSVEQSPKDDISPVDIVDVEHSEKGFSVSGENKQEKGERQSIDIIEEPIKDEERAEKRKEIILTEETPKVIRLTTVDTDKEEVSHKEPPEMSEYLSQKDLPTSTCELNEKEEVEITPIDIIAERQGAVDQKDKDISALELTLNDDVIDMEITPTDAVLDEQHQNEIKRDNEVAELPENQAEEMPTDSIDYSEKSQSAIETSEKDTDEEQQIVERSSEQDISMDVETTNSHVELVPADEVDETIRPEEQLREYQESVEQSPKDDITPVNIVEEKQSKADQSEQDVYVSEEIKQEKGKLTPIDIVEEVTNTEAWLIHIIDEPISTGEMCEKEILLSEQTKRNNEIAAVNTDKEVESPQEPLEKESSTPDVGSKDDIDIYKEKEMPEYMSHKDIITAEVTAKEEGEITPVDKVAELQAAVDQQDKAISASEETLKYDPSGVVITHTDVDQDGQQHREEIPKDSVVAELPLNQEAWKIPTDAIDFSEEVGQSVIEPSKKEIALIDTVEEQKIVAESPEKNISADEETIKFVGQLVPVHKVGEFISPEEQPKDDQESVEQSPNDVITPVDIVEEKQCEVEQSEKDNSVSDGTEQEAGELSLIGFVEELSTGDTSEKDILSSEGSRKDIEIMTVDTDEGKENRQEPLEKERPTADVNAKGDFAGKGMSEGLSPKDLSTAEETEKEEVKIIPIDIVTEHQGAIDPPDKDISASMVTLKDDVIDVAITHADAYQDDQQHQEEKPRYIEVAEVPANEEANDTIDLIKQITQSAIEPSVKDIVPVDTVEEQQNFEEPPGKNISAYEETAKSDVKFMPAEKVEATKCSEEQLIADQKSVDQSAKDDITSVYEKQSDFEQSGKDVSESGVIEHDKDIVEDPVSADELSGKCILLTGETPKDIEIMTVDTDQEEVSQHEPLEKESFTADDDVVDLNGEKEMSDDLSQNDLSAAELTEKDDVEITLVDIVAEHQGAGDQQEKDISADVETLKEDVDEAKTPTDANQDEQQRQVEIPKDSIVAQLPVNEVSVKSPVIDPSEKDIAPVDTVEEQHIVEEPPEKNISVHEETAKFDVQLMLSDKIEATKCQEEQLIEDQKSVEQSTKDDVVDINGENKMSEDLSQNDLAAAKLTEKDDVEITPTDAGQDEKQRQIEIQKNSVAAELPANQKAEKTPTAAIYFDEESQSVIKPSEKDIDPVDTVEEHQNFERALEKDSTLDEKTAKTNVELMPLDTVDATKCLEEQIIENQKSVKQSPKDDISPVDIADEKQKDVKQSEKDVSLPGKTEQEKGELMPIDIVEEPISTDKRSEEKVLFTEETLKDIEITTVDTDNEELSQQEPLEEESSTPGISTKDDVDISKEKEMLESLPHKDLSTAVQQDKDLSASEVTLKDDVVDVTITSQGVDQDDQQRKLGIPKDSVVGELPANEEAVKTPTTAIDLNEETQSVINPSEQNIVSVQNVEESPEKDISANEEIANSYIKLMPVDNVDETKSTEEQLMEDQELVEQSSKDDISPVDIVDEKQSDVEHSEKGVQISGEAEREMGELTLIDIVEEPISAEERPDKDILLTEETPKETKIINMDTYKDEVSHQESLEKESSTPNVSTKDEDDISEEKELSDNLSQRDLSTVEIAEYEELEIKPIVIVAEHQGTIDQQDKDISESEERLKDELVAVEIAPTDVDQDEQHHQIVIPKDSVIAELQANEKAERTPTDSINLSQEIQSATEPSENDIAPIVTIEKQQIVAEFHEKDISTDEETTKSSGELMPVTRVNEAKIIKGQLIEEQESDDQSPMDNITLVDIVKKKQSEIGKLEKDVLMSGEIELEKSELTQIVIEEPISADDQSEKEVQLTEETPNDIDSMNAYTDKEEENAPGKERITLDVNAKDSVGISEEKEILKDLSQKDPSTAELTEREAVEITPIDIVVEHNGAVCQQEEDTASEKTLKDNVVAVKLTPKDTYQDDQQHQDEISKDSVVAELLTNETAEKMSANTIDTSEEIQLVVEACEMGIAPGGSVDGQQFVVISPEKDINACEKLQSAVEPSEKNIAAVKTVANQQIVEQSLTPVDTVEEKQCEADYSEKYVFIADATDQDNDAISPIDMANQKVYTEERHAKDTNVDVEGSEKNEIPSQINLTATKKRLISSEKLEQIFEVEQKLAATTDVAVGNASNEGDGGAKVFEQGVPCDRRIEATEEKDEEMPETLQLREETSFLENDADEIIITEADASKVDGKESMFSYELDDVTVILYIDNEKLSKNHFQRSDGAEGKRKARPVAKLDHEKGDKEETKEHKNSKSNLISVDGNEPDDSWTDISVIEETGDKELSEIQTFSQTQTEVSCMTESSKHLVTDVTSSNDNLSTEQSNKAHGCESKILTECTTGYTDETSTFTNSELTIYEEKHVFRTRGEETSRSEYETLQETTEIEEDFSETFDSLTSGEVTSTKTGKTKSLETTVTNVRKSSLSDIEDLPSETES